MGSNIRQGVCVQAESVRTAQTQNIVCEVCKSAGAHGDLKQAQELVGVPFDREEELLKAKIDFEKLEARLSGLSEQQDAIIDPDETDEDETAEERAEHEEYQNADDDDLPMIPDDNAPRHGPRR